MTDVLFVCVHNAGRSQMARALFNAVSARRGLSLKAVSTGTEPAPRVHDHVIEAMRELGLDLSTEYPKLLDNDTVKQASRIITMGCAVDSESCPAIFIKDVEDWGLPDPKGRSLGEVRAIRDAIRRKVAGLINGMDSRH